MAKKKKSSGNGFFQFLIKIKETKKIPMRKAQEIASDLWKNMSTEERQSYKDMANKGSKSKLPQNNKPKVIQKPKDDKFEIEYNMRVQVQEKINNICRESDISEEYFFVIHMNKLIYHSPTKKYFPCEIALACFSLKTGLMPDVFHNIIKQNELPIGYKYEAKNYSDQTHQLYNLMFQTNEKITKTESRVFYDMLHYIKKYNENFNVILFVLEKNFDIVYSVLNRWDTANYNKFNLSINKFEFLFQILRNTTAGYNIWPHDQSCHNEVENDKFGYTPNIGCEYHEICDRYYHCSKSIVTRNVYLICSFCSTDLKITLIDGHHIPKNYVLIVNENENNQNNSGSLNMDDNPAIMDSNVSNV